MGGFEKAITGGGDDRGALGVDGRNRYGIAPCGAERVFQRGSCTCAPLTEAAAPAVRRLFRMLRDGEISLGAVRDCHRERIRALFRSCPRHEIFFAPSGTDLCYHALLLQWLLSPGRPILNVVTRHDELGSGSATAHAGRFFSGRSQICGGLSAGGALADWLRVETRLLPSRDEAGRVLDLSDEVRRAARECEDDSSLLVNLVAGSKSGISDDLSAADDLSRAGALIVVDACQFRATRDLVSQMLGRGFVVMLSGSKFFEAPPFCGVLLVPEVVCQAVESVGFETLGGFDLLLSQRDIPERFGRLRRALPDVENEGLALRWEAALFEMEHGMALDGVAVAQAIAHWRRGVVEALTVRAGFELMPGHDDTDASIVSFRARAGFWPSQPAQVDALFREVVGGAVTVPGYDRVFIGQPVRFKEESFLRIAIGSCGLRRLMDSGMDLSEDLRLVEGLDRWVRERATA